MLTYHQLYASLYRASMVYTYQRIAVSCVMWCISNTDLYLEFIGLFDDKIPKYKSKSLVLRWMHACKNEKSHNSCKNQTPKQCLIISSVKC